MMKILTTLTILGLLSSPLWAAERIDESKEISSDGSVFISIPSGEIEIQSWSKNELQIKGSLPEEFSEYQFEGTADNLKFIIVDPYADGESHNSKFYQSGAELTVYVPENIDLEIEGKNTTIVVTSIYGGTVVKTVNGDITADDLRQRIELKTVNGDIEAKKLNGKIELSTVNGDITDKSSQGRLQFQNVNGEIVSSSSANEIKIETVNGSIEMELATIDDLVIETVNSDIEINLALSEKGQVDINSVSGDIVLDFPQSIDAQFSLKTHVGGSIDNDLTKDKEKDSGFFDVGSQLDFNSGSGKGKVTVNTMSGDIDIK